MSFMYDGLRKQARSRKPPRAGAGVPHGNGFSEGDVVTTFIDFDKQEISFAVNGVHEGVAFKGFVEKGKGELRVTVTCKDAQGKQKPLYPGIGLSGSMGVEVNFGHAPFV
jgi:hypothetical protein